MTARRALGLLFTAVAAAAVLHAAGSALPAPPVAEPARLDDWWIDTGAAAVVLTLARIGGLAFCCYLTLIGLLGTVAALTRWRWTVSLTMWAATPAIRRAFAGGSLALALTSGSAATAAAAPATFSVTDVGAIQESRAESVRFASDGSATIPASRMSYSVTDLGASSVPADHRIVVDIGVDPVAPASYSVTDLGPAPTAPSMLRNDSAPRIDDRSSDPNPSEAASRYGLTSRAPATDATAAQQHTEPNDTTTPAAHTKTNDTATPAAHTKTNDTTTPAAHTESNDTTTPAAHTESNDGAATPVDGASDAAGLDNWIVQPGDHLWGIAAATVAERSGSEDHMTVTRYWLKLIELNSDTVGDDPDLIYPGQVIRLPD